MRKVAVVGVGMTRFGEHWDKGIRALISEAGLAALKDAKMESKQIDALFGGNMSSGHFEGQEHIGALIAEQMGMNPKPSTRVEAACASGGLAFRMGVLAVASGLHDIVAVGGVEKMTDVPVEKATSVLGGAGDEEWELFYGATFPALYALMARRHMLEYGTTEEQMAAVAVKNHKHGSMNPYAQFQDQITIEDVLKSSPVAEPLKLLDCSPLSDGAAVVIIAAEDVAKKLTDTPIWVAGSGQGSDTIALHSRKSLTSVMAAREAAAQAYKMAGVGQSDIKIAEVHDCFSIAEIMAIEDLGFFPKGQGGPATFGGQTAIGGKVAVNTSGGLKACGHPVGATGVKQIIELTWQLRGEAGKRQAKGEVALAHNVGGTGATCVVHVLRR